MPLETISGAGRTSRREAGTTAASLGMAATWAKTSAVFSISVFLRECGEKIKGRLLAADEKTGEADILSRNCQGTQGAGSALGDLLCSLFIRHAEYGSPACFCQGSSDGIMTRRATLRFTMSYGRVATYSSAAIFRAEILVQRFLKDLMGKDFMGSRIS